MNAEQRQEWLAQGNPEPLPMKFAGKGLGWTRNGSLPRLGQAVHTCGRGACSGSERKCMGLMYTTRA